MEAPPSPNIPATAEPKLAERVAKKALERLYLTGFLDALGEDLVHDPAEERESPDFLLRSASRRVGLELRRLFRPPEARRGGLREQESLQFQVMNRARELYAAWDLAPVDVHALFAQETLRKSDIQRYVEGIAELAAGLEARAPAGAPGAEVMADEHWPALAHLPALARVHVCRYASTRENFFAPSMAAFKPVLGAQYLAREIDAKEGKVARYALACDEAWLLLAYGMEGLPAWLSFEPAALEHVYRSRFARIYLFGGSGALTRLRVAAPD